MDEYIHCRIYRPYILNRGTDSGLQCNIRITVKQTQLLAQYIEVLELWSAASDNSCGQIRTHFQTRNAVSQRIRGLGIEMTERTQ